MDINHEVQEYEARVSKMISEGGLGVSAYYDYDNPKRDTVTTKPQEAHSEFNNSSSSST